MRQIVKTEKNGKDVTYICSQCGELIHRMFIPLGKKKFEPNWDKIPEKCYCGARLINRKPIIDANDNIDDSVIDDNCDIDVNCDIVDDNITDSDIDDNCDIYDSVKNYSDIDNSSKKIGKNGYGNISEKSEIYRKTMIDLETAISIDYFDLRLNGLKKHNIKIPDNIDILRLECVERNISHVELSSKNPHMEIENKEIEERLNNLRQKYNDLSKRIKY